MQATIMKDLHNISRAPQVSGDETRLLELGKIMQVVWAVVHAITA